MEVVSVFTVFVSSEESVSACQLADVFLVVTRCTFFLAKSTF